MGSRSTKSGYADCSKGMGSRLGRTVSARASGMMPIRSSLIAVRPPVWHGLFEDLEPAVPDDQDQRVVDRVPVSIERE